MHEGVDICAGVVLGVLGVAVGWGWYFRELQTILEGDLLREVGEEEVKRKLSVGETCRPGCGTGDGEGGTQG